MRRFAQTHRSATPSVQGFVEIVLQWRNMQNFGVTMARNVRNGVIARLVRSFYTIVKFLAKTFKKCWIYRDFCGIVCANERRFFMATKKLLTNGNAFKRTDGRWGGTVWFMDESGERKRKSFSGTTKQEVNKKMTAYIEDFNCEIQNSIEANKTLQESMTNWLQVFKFPSVERTTYDRYECTAINQIYPLIGEKTVGIISSADIKKSSITG